MPRAFLGTKLWCGGATGPNKFDCPGILHSGVFLRDYRVLGFFQRRFFQERTQGLRSWEKVFV